MIPKVKAALSALAWEGTEAIISDGAAENALERSLSDPTFGTRVSARAAGR
jgi:acetylglutamate kinase